MSVIRVNKNENYSVISNIHLQDRRLTLKSKGMLSLMLSLSNNWEYSVAGLVSICKESETSIKTALNELKEYGYLIITKLKPNETISGRIEYIYDIYESPKQEVEKQGVEKQGVENLGVENQGQYNTNNKILKNKNTKNSNKGFKPPTIKEVENYCLERNNGVDFKKFYDYFEEGGWKDSNGKKVISWKQKIITWEKFSSKKNDAPEWLNKELKCEKMSDEELEKLKKELN